MPVRNINNRYGKNVVGQVPSLKLDRMITYESRIERDWIYLMEHDPDVVFYEEQPLTIEYKHLGKQYKYTPDFKAVKANGQQVLVECKASVYVEKERNQRRMVAARRWCATRHWTYQVITEIDVKNLEHRLKNVKLLYRYARNPVSVDLRARIYDVLSWAGCLPLSELAAQIRANNLDVGRGAILTMLWHRELQTDIDTAAISNKSYICLPKAKEVTK
ncbi:MAG: TnsA endonuclease N-terminal domain-containing protein [Anaerolineae bacterium]|nr:TnsA endonuclease N-terminal domain-containing protein [Anaerolineae bacterium]